MDQTNARRRFLMAAMQGFDISMLGGALWVVWLFEQPAGSIAYVPPSSWRFVIWVTLSLLAWHVCLSRASLYESRRLTAGAGEAAEVIAATGLATAIMAGAAVVLRVELVTLPMIVYAWLVSTATIVVGRGALRATLVAVRGAGRNLRHVLIVGGGPRAQRLARELAQRTDLGYHVIGYVDERELAAQATPSMTCVGTLDQLGAVLANTVVDEVAIALPVKSLYREMTQMIATCAEQGVRARVFLDLFDVRVARPRFELFEGVPVLTLSPHGVGGWPAVVKRILDIAISATLLVLLAPFFAVIGLAIKASGPGPVFFVQSRVGLHKRTFGMIKFRTMVHDAEANLGAVLHLNEARGPVFKIRDDPRLTRVGRILRRTSIDELPQLINVLMGDMSLVGPRPLPVRDVHGFSADWHRRRFSVKPGMTCSWQVNGRHIVPFDRWMELDMAYIDNWSLWLDLKILVQTVPSVLRRTGAY